MDNNRRQQKLIMYCTTQSSNLQDNNYYRELTYKILLNNSILKNERTKANEKEVKVGVATDQMGVWLRPNGAWLVLW